MLHPPGAGGAVPSRSPSEPGPTRPPDEGLSAGRRLRQTSLFGEAYAQDRCYRGRYMVLFLRQGAGASLRLGVVTSRKVGAAVARVRARRLLRESFRRSRQRLSGPYDVVLIARASVLGASRDEITGELLQLAERAGLLRSAGVE